MTASCAIPTRTAIWPLRYAGDHRQTHSLGHHWARDIVFSPDGRTLLLSVGSGSNVAVNMFPQPLIKGALQEWIKTRLLGATWDTEEPRADVLAFDPDGKNERIVATGLRNCQGLAILPATVTCPIFRATPSLRRPPRFLPFRAPCRTAMRRGGARRLHIPQRSAPSLGMPPPRANWKGLIKISELLIPVALFSASVTSQRVSFHTINRQTGNRVCRQFIDEETEQPVEKEPGLRNQSKSICRSETKPTRSI